MGKSGISQQHYSKYEKEEYELPLRHFITLANYYQVSADYLIDRCSYDEKKPLEMVYVTRDRSCEKLLQDILSLGEHGRASVLEYVELQKPKEKSKQNRGKYSFSGMGRQFVRRLASMEFFSCQKPEGYRCYAYGRLSRRDKEKAQKDNDESNSIKNQRDLIHEYIDRHPDLELCMEGYDDNYSGTNFAGVR